jgi:serine/threonine protein kinase
MLLEKDRTDLADDAETESLVASGCGHGRSSTPRGVLDNLNGVPHVPRIELELLSTIGEGGFCEVWEGRWFGAQVAIKRLKLVGRAEDDAALAADFVREINLHASLAFPLVIPLLGACLEDPRDLLLVMEQAPLGSLFNVLHVHSHRTAP